jgi:hypothetical protein
MVPHMQPQEMIEQRLRDGDRIYGSIAPQLEAEHKGKVVAIHIESGKYFVGLNELDAYEQAEKTIPGCKVVFYKIGSKYVQFIG